MKSSIRKISVLTVLSIFVSFTVLTLCYEDSQARRRSSRRISSFKFTKSSNSWKKSSSPSKNIWGNRNGGGIFGFKKSSSKPKPKKSWFSSFSGYKKNKSQKPSAFKPKSKFDKKTTRNLKKKQASESFAAYKSRKNKFKKEVKPVKLSQNFKRNPIFNKAKTYSNYDYRTYYNNRDSYYNKHGWRRPAYAFASQPRFGIWDAMVWWMVLDNLGSRNHYAMAYHHSNDPGYKKWRAEAEKLALTNSELKQKLASLDNRMAQMQGTPKNVSYLPDDMPAEVALAADVLAAKNPEKPQFILATASRSGNYHKFGKLLQANAETVNVQLRTTAGSIENLALLTSQKVDAAILQSDAFATFKDKIQATEQTPLYFEAVQMIANKNSGIVSVKDINPGRHILYIGPKGSGTEMTWLGFCSQDKEYRNIETRNASYEDALEQVITNKNAVMMFVSGLKSRLLHKAEQAARKYKNIRLIEVNDWNFNDATDAFGNKIYKFVDIPPGIYPALQKGFIRSRNIETIAVEAILAVRTDWAQKYGPEAMDALSFAIMETKPMIESLTNGLE